MKLFVIICVAFALCACNTPRFESADKVWDAYLEKKARCPDSMPSGTVEEQSYRSDTREAVKALQSSLMNARIDERRVRSDLVVRCRSTRVKTAHGWESAQRAQARSRGPRQWVTSNQTPPTAPAEEVKKQGGFDE